MPDTPTDRLTRWRLILGEASETIATANAEGAGEGQGEGEGQLTGDLAGMDRVLQALYDQEEGERGSLGRSQPSVNRWLGDIRRYFPRPVVRILQQDAWERLGLERMLLEPETLAAAEPDVQLVATLLSLRDVIPQKTRETAREVVAKVAADLYRRLQLPTAQAVRGALHRGTLNRRPRLREIHWDRTIRANLRHYQPELGTIIPERLLGYGRKQGKLKDVILCVDQSDSMAGSIVYTSVFGAVLASLPALRTHFVAFDTSVVDLTHDLHDPVDLLFGMQLGGGTDIERALAYCHGLIRRPSDTLLILISDLFEGGNRQRLLQRMAQLKASRVQMICLLALHDQGRPHYDQRLAAELAQLGIPAFACTPDAFPPLMAAAIQGRDLQAYAAGN
ncbi:MAG: VWA domain-containing protein [Bacteroidetes bacterium]|nr:MAG: VWA domain-containing protein [Bacteroidota bacterium]